MLDEMSLELLGMELLGLVFDSLDALNIIINFSSRFEEP